MHIIVMNLYHASYTSRTGMLYARELQNARLFGFGFYSKCSFNNACPNLLFIGYEGYLAETLQIFKNYFLSYIRQSAAGMCRVILIIFL